MGTHNQFGIKNGEMLPVMGGPHDGAKKPVEVLFPGLDGGLPCTHLRIRDSIYALNAEKRQWDYIGAMPHDRRPAAQEHPPHCGCGAVTVRSGDAFKCLNCGRKFPPARRQ